MSKTLQNPIKFILYIVTEFILKIYIRLSDYNWTRTQNHLVLKRTLNQSQRQFDQMVECSFKN